MSETKKNMKKCGYIALVGRPNAGKSTLMNACIGQKVAGVSNKPQTTRNRILGIATQNETQLLFLDTPGLHRSGGYSRINSLMNKEAWGVLNDADVICMMVDLTGGVEEQDLIFFRQILETATSPVMLLLSKIDKKKADALFKRKQNIISAFSEVYDALDEELRGKLIHPIGDPFEISAKRPERVAEFCEKVGELVPEGEWLYNEDDLTNRSTDFLMSELIRESVFRLLGQEIPYHTAVIVEDIDLEKPVIHVTASIVVSRNSQKGMVVGKGGSKIREIGILARKSIEQHFDRQVFLDLHVRVQEGWVDRNEAITELTSIGDHS